MAIYYVSDQNGNDSNAGTSVGAAKKTVAAGLALMSTAGDILYIGPGVYYHTTDNAINGSGIITNPKKIIGDTQAEYLTSDTPGEVILTAMNSATMIPVLSISGLTFSSDNYWHVKNLTFAGYTGTFGIGIECNNSNGVFIENCHFSNCYHGIRNNSLTFDVTIYNCSVISGNLGIMQCNSINCVVIGCDNGVYRSYAYGNLVIGCRAGYIQCWCDQYGSLTTDYGSVYNSTSIGGSTSYSQCSGQNNLSSGTTSTGAGFTFGNHNMIGCYSYSDYYSYRDGETSATGIFPNINSGSALSSCYYSGYHVDPNFSPDDINFTPTQGQGMIYVGYVGICNDIQHMFRTRPLTGTEMFVTASTGLPFYVTQITGSAALGSRTEALEAFVSGSGIRYASNWLKDTYPPPASYDTIGIPMGNIKASGDGFTDTNKLQGAFPGYQFPDSPTIDNTYVTGSIFGIKALGYGGFALAANVSGSLTASVSVKYNVTSDPPKILLVDKLVGGQVVSASASGTGDQTGAWQTLTVNTNTANPIDVVLVNVDTDAASYVHFSNFDLNG
jgi:hypothetical protein